MKSLILFLSTLLLCSLSRASKDPNSTQPTPTPPVQVQYDETPQLVREKTIALPQPIPQTQLLSPNVQTQSIILPPSSAMPGPHIVRGFNLDNIDPELEIVKPTPIAPAPVANKNKALDMPKANGVDKGEMPKMNNEANLRLNKTHNLSKKKKSL